MRGDALDPPEPRIPTCADGSASEGQSRKEFAAGGGVKGVRVPGLPIHGVEVTGGSVSVEVGINIVFAAHAAIWTDIYSINSDGDIVGAYEDASGVHGFIGKLDDCD